MKLKQKVLFALAALSSVGFIHAQDAHMENVPTGTLGQRYGDVNIGLQDIQHFSDDAYSMGVGANIPVAGNFDATFDFGHAWLNSTVDQTADAVSVTGTRYLAIQGIKPFAYAGVGYEWDKVSFGRAKDHSQYGIWGLGVGVEIPASLAFPTVEGLSMTPLISYSDDFRKSHNSGQACVYSMEANQWINHQMAVYADIGFQDVLHSEFDSWLYTLGVRIRY